MWNCVVRFNVKELVKSFLITIGVAYHEKQDAQVQETPTDWPNVEKRGK